MTQEEKRLRQQERRLKVRELQELALGNQINDCTGCT